MTQDKSAPPQYIKLKEAHPTFVKFAKLADFAEELGISFSFESCGVIIYDKDRDRNLPPVILKDIEKF